MDQVPGEKLEKRSLSNMQGKQFAEEVRVKGQSSQYSALYRRVAI